MLLLSNGANFSPVDDCEDTPLLCLDPEISTFKKCVLAMLTELCKIENKKLPFSPKDKESIMKYGFAFDHFDKCTLEFNNMKSVVLDKTLTFHSILTSHSDVIEKLSMLVNNKTVVKNFMINIQKFPMYKADLKKVLIKAIKRNKELSAMDGRLLNTDVHFLPVVSRINVLKHLTLKDLPLRKKKLSKVSFSLTSNYINYGEKSSHRATRHTFVRSSLFSQYEVKGVHNRKKILTIFFCA